MISIKENLNANVYIELYGDNKYKNFNTKILKEAFEKNLYSIVLYQDDIPIGMGRILGDDRTVFFIKDVIVLDEFHGKGYGKLIMSYLLSYIKDKGVKGAYIGLMSTPGKEEFYKKFGFIERPNKDFGSGMVMFNE